MICAGPLSLDAAETPRPLAWQGLSLFVASRDPEAWAVLLALLEWIERRPLRSVPALWRVAVALRCHQTPEGSAAMALLSTEQATI